MTCLSYFEIKYGVSMICKSVHSICTDTLDSVKPFSGSRLVKVCMMGVILPVMTGSKRYAYT